MTTPPVLFDYAAWLIRYPEFSNVPEPLAQAYFDEAGTLIGNDASNLAFGVTVYEGSTPVPLLKRLLYMVTAHIAQMNSGANGQGGPSGVIGRISSASEGSVSVSSEYGTSGGPSEAFFLQTRYGVAYWAATAQFRTMQYVAQPTVVADGAYPFLGTFIGGRRIY